MGEAIEKYKKAHQLNRSSPFSLLGWGLAMASDDKNEESLKRFEEAAEVDPEEPLTYFTWGNILKGMGRHTEAIAKYQKAIEKPVRLCSFLDKHG